MLIKSKQPSKNAFTEIITHFKKISKSKNYKSKKYTYVNI